MTTTNSCHNNNIIRDKDNLLTAVSRMKETVDVVYINANKADITPNSKNRKNKLTDKIIPTYKYRDITKANACYKRTSSNNKEPSFNPNFSLATKPNTMLSTNANDDSSKKRHDFSRCTIQRITPRS